MKPYRLFLCLALCWLTLTACAGLAAPQPTVAPPSPATVAPSPAAVPAQATPAPAPTQLPATPAPIPTAGQSLAAPVGMDGTLVKGTGGQPWWNDAVFYEVFVRSFFDSNGDGIGDLNGLIRKLDYLNDGNPDTATDPSAGSSLP